MKSALEIVAFSACCEFTGTVALLETAIKALDRSGQRPAAAYVDMALNLFIIEAEETAARNFDEITDHG